MREGDKFEEETDGGEKHPGIMGALGVGRINATPTRHPRACPEDP